VLFRVFRAFRVFRGTSALKTTENTETHGDTVIGREVVWMID